MKSLAVLVLAALAAAPVFTLAQTYGEPQGGAQPDRRSNKPLAEGAKDSITEGKNAVKKSGRDLSAEVKKDTRAVKRRSKLSGAYLREHDAAVAWAALLGDEKAQKGTKTPDVPEVAGGEFEQAVANLAQ